MKKRKLPIRFYFDDTLYSARIFVVIGGTWEEISTRWVKEFNAEGTTKNVINGGAYLPNNSKDCGVWFKEIPTGSICAHEALHLTTHILIKSGLRFSEDSEEAWAYHMQWIVREIGNKVW